MRSSTSSASRRRVASASDVPAPGGSGTVTIAPTMSRGMSNVVPQRVGQQVRRLPGEVRACTQRTRRSPTRAAARCPRAPPDSSSDRRWRCARTRRGSRGCGPTTRPERGASTAARAPPRGCRSRAARAPTCAGWRRTSRRRATGCRAPASPGHARRRRARARRGRGTRPRWPPPAAPAPSAR